VASLVTRALSVMDVKNMFAVNVMRQEFLEAMTLKNIGEAKK